MLEKSRDRVELLRKGIDGKKIEQLYLSSNNFVILQKNDPSQKVNCWEFMNCGRELGGEKADKLGVCPVATDISADGLNRGKVGGRICWAISRKSGGKRKEGKLAKKLLFCESCSFFKLVKEEEGGERFVSAKPENLKLTQEHFQKSQDPYQAHSS
ncbi:MAG TPA: hypothetical protein VKL21_05665 [Candidatus Methanoperedens sp.]|nr:hypothetical protein [Candidatus Methanoperedens sp.]